MTEQTTAKVSSIDGAASALDVELGGEESAWQAMERRRQAFEFFAAAIFGFDVTRLGALYLNDETIAAWEAWQEAEENETMPALGPERETLKELARLSIENLRLKQTTPNAWRDKLATELLHRIELDTDNGNLNTDRAIILLAQAWLQQNEIEYNFPEDLMARYGVELPDEYDATDEMTRIFGLMNKWNVGRALAFLIDAMTENYERRVNIHDGEIQSPRILLAAAALVNLDANAFREPPPATVKVQPKTAKTKATKPAPTPSDAAHASDVSAQPAAPAEEPKAAKKPAAKKAKAKADPAPASPANEAAAPPTPPRDPWPFPIQKEAA